MSKDLTVSMLMDFYGQLLTDKQLDTLDMYYNQDLSLAEIAEQTGISRQGARDSIKRGEKQLNDFEDKLGLVKKFISISGSVRELEKIADGLLERDAENEGLKKIKAVTHRIFDEI